MIVFFVRMAVEVMVWLILIRCVLSFIPHNPYNPILRFVYETTSPLLDICGKVLPDALKYPMDWTPMVALVVLQMLVLPILMRIAYAIQGV